MKGSYLHHKEVKAAQGIKIAAQNLENSVAGTQMLVAGPDDDIDELKEEVMQDIEDIFSSVDRSGARARPCAHPTAQGPSCSAGVGRAQAHGPGGRQVAWDYITF